jgi:hypothetical protein
VTDTVVHTRTVRSTTTVPLCHRVGTAKNHKYVLVKVTPASVNAHLRHGDKATVRGNCAALNKHR